ALERGDAQQGVDPPPSVEKPAPPLHERLLDYESEPHNRATGLFDDFSESLGGTAAGEKVVDHEYPAASREQSAGDLHPVLGALGRRGDLPHVRRALGSGPEALLAIEHRNTEAAGDGAPREGTVGRRPGTIAPR